MKREEIIVQKSSPLLDFLQSHNCSFYSPLSQDDTSDWISGNAMQKYANNSVVWDSNINMWMFTYVNGQPYGTNQYFAKWTLKDSIANGSLIFLSCAAEIYPYDTAQSGTQYNQMCYDLLPTRSGLALYATQNQINNSCQTFVVENGRTIQYQYMNGTNSVVYSYTSVISVNNTKNEISIGQYPNIYGQKRYGMRNFAFFYGTVLTTQEINEYFSLI